MMPLHDLFAAMAELGILGLEYDPAYGGQGADHLFTLILAEEFGRADHGSLPMALGVQVDMATPSLHDFGTPQLKERFLAPALRGEMVTSIAVTEPDAGSDVAGVRTHAERDGDEWVINGSKMYITNSLQADWLCVLARTSDEGGYRGMSQIIVPTDTPGFEVAKKLDKLGMRASDAGLLSFSDCRVPVSNTIGEIGRGFQQQMTQSWSSGCGAPTAVGAPGRLSRRRKVPPQATRVPALRCSPTSTSSSVWLRLAAEVDLLRTYNTARRGRAGRGHQTAGDDRKVQGRPALTRGRGLVPAVPRRCRVHGRNVDGTLLP